MIYIYRNKECRAEFDGYKLPDPEVVVPKFLHSDYAKEMEDLLIRAYEEKLILSDTDYLKMVNFLLVCTKCFHNFLC